VIFLKLSRLHMFAIAPDLKKQAQGGRGESNNKHKSRTENATGNRGAMYWRALDFCDVQTQRAPK
jgi:hypothetical protein